MWFLSILLFSAPVLAGPGFDGVGDRGAVPRFDRPPHEARMVEEVLAREDEILAAVAEHDPAMHARLVELKKLDHRAYVVTLVRVARRAERLRGDPRARERFEEIRTLEGEIRELARDFRQLPEEQQAARRAQMEALAPELFELKQAERRASLSELQRRIEGLSEEIEQREAQRETLIEDYLDQLTKERVGL